MSTDYRHTDAYLDYLIDKSLDEQIERIPEEHSAFRKYLANFRTEHKCQ